MHLCVWAFLMSAVTRHGGDEDKYSTVQGVCYCLAGEVPGGADWVRGSTCFVSSASSLSQSKWLAPGVLVENVSR